MPALAITSSVDARPDRGIYKREINKSLANILIMRCILLCFVQSDIGYIRGTEIDKIDPQLVRAFQNPDMYAPWAMSPLSVYCHSHQFKKYEKSAVLLRYLWS
jgi:hypothetical protein